MPRPLLVLAPAALLGLTLTVPAALAQAGPGVFLDTVDVRVVNLEVIVSDRDGRAVTDLTRDDFVVLEDGREAEITNFYVVADGAALLPEGEPAGFEPTAPPKPDTSRLNLVVFVDNLNIRPENRALILDNLEAYLRERLDPRDRVMLVAANDDVRIEQPFTNDVEALAATLGRLKKTVGRHMQYEVEYRTLTRSLQQASLALPPEAGGPPTRGESTFAFDTAVIEAGRLAREVRVVAERRMAKVRRTAETLKGFTSTLAGMKGRKAVLYVSDGLPVRAADSLVQAWLGKYENWILQVEEQRLLGEINALVGLEFDASSVLEAAIAEAGANRVVIYPISFQGKRGTTSLSAEFRGSATIAGGSALSLDVVSSESLVLEDSLLRMADGTGGVAFTRTANIGKLLDRVVQDFRTFYSIGYVRPPGAEERGYRKIEVRVKDRELEVRHLEGFRDKDAIDDLEDQTMTASMYGVDSNPLGVRLEPQEQIRSGSRRFEVPIQVQIPLRNLLFLPQDEAHVGQVTLVVVARDERGGTSPFQRIEVPIQIANDQILAAMSGVAAYPMRLRLNPGRKKISVGVRDHLGRVNSTLSVDLEVGSGREASAGPAP